MVGMIPEFITYLKDGNFDKFSRLLHDEWKLKASLSDKVSNGEIDLLYDTIRSLDKDNIGGKLCGAGGGGFLLFVIPPKLIDKIQHDFAYSYTGVRIKTDTKGVKVLYEY